jgi:Holliday junction resolvasome RuvABC endonuclease subunit
MTGAANVIERDLFLGVDPGQSGGLAILDPSGAVVDLSPMPETEHDLSAYVAEFAGRIRTAAIEQVHSMPKQGVSSSFKFGMSYGGLRMALIAHGVRFEAVTPQAWQKALHCLSGGDKNKTKAKAQELWPAQKITHAIADALLIAEYARRTNV